MDGPALAGAALATWEVPLTGEAPLLTTFEVLTGLPYLAIA